MTENIVIPTRQPAMLEPAHREAEQSWSSGPCSVGPDLPTRADRFLFFFAIGMVGLI